MATGWKSFYNHVTVKQDDEVILETKAEVVPKAKDGQCPQCLHGRFKIRLGKGSQMFRTCDPDSGGCGYELEAID